MKNRILSQCSTHCPALVNSGGFIYITERNTEKQFEIIINTEGFSHQIGVKTQ